MKIKDVLLIDEVELLKICLSLIALRDRNSIDGNLRISAPLDGDFWAEIDSYGKRSFNIPTEDEILNTEILQLPDDRGYIFDIDLPVKNSREGEFGSVVITLEVDKTSSPSRVCISGAYW